MQASRTYQETAKYVRNALRKFSVESVADAALNSFAFFRGKGQEELRSAPWLAALIVKFVLEDKQIPLRSGGGCPPELFDRLRQLLWEVSPISTNGGAPAVHLALRVMFHTQLQFQQPESWSFLRWPALIHELPDNHPTKQQFERVLGMSPDAFIGICWGAYAAVVNGNQVIERSYFQSLEPLYGSAVSSFLAQFSRDLTGLRNELRAAFDTRLATARSRGDAASVRDPIEVTEFPWLQQYPLLLHHSGNFAVWHPLIFARGMEQAVHQSLSRLGQEYTDHFSKVFEKYVLDLLRDGGLKYVDETTFKSVHSRAAPAVEAIVEFESGKFLVESKMSLFPDEVVSSDSADVVFRKLRRVREAIVQGWRVTDLVASNSESRGQNYLVVVTSRQLNVCNGEQLKRMFGENIFENILPEARFGPPNERQQAWLPPENMFFLSIEEFEHLSGALRQGEVELWSFLSEAAKLQTNAASSVFHFDQLLGGRTKRWMMPDVQVRARDRVESQFRRFFET